MDEEMAQSRLNGEWGWGGVQTVMAGFGWGQNSKAFKEDCKLELLISIGTSHFEWKGGVSKAADWSHCTGMVLFETSELECFLGL